jgi:hypothetical protein
MIKCKRKIILLFFFCWISTKHEAQTDSTKPPIAISGYIEAYYSYDFSNPSNHLRPPFFCSYNRHNEFNLNLGYIMASYNKDGVRANLGLMAGTYAQYNLASEPSIMQHVYQATAGVKLSKKHNLWIDAGIMPSHIGWESAVGKDSWNLTRSIAADNSPYYETGAKLGYASPNEKFYFALMVLNGWQHIQRVLGSQTPSGGAQLIWKPSSKFSFNWNTFAGNEFPDPVRKWRFFNDFYAQWLPHKSFGIIAGFDIGLQQKYTLSYNYSIWYSPVLIARINITDKLHIGLRGEYFYDKDQVIIKTGLSDGFQTWGYSLNFDYNIKQNVVWRIEGRGLSSINTIFGENGHFTNENYFATTSLAIAF